MAANSLKKNRSEPEGGKSEFLRGLEDQMKTIWRQYVERLEKNGFDEEAQDLRGKYFSLYRCYKMNREWLGAVSQKSQS